MAARPSSVDQPRLGSTQTNAIIYGSMFIHPSVPVPDCGRISDPAALSPQGTTTTSLLAVILENAWPPCVAPSRPFTLRLAKIAPDWRIHPILIYPALGRTRRLLVCSPHVSWIAPSRGLVLTRPHHRTPQLRFDFADSAGSPCDSHVSFRPYSFVRGFHLSLRPRDPS